MQLLRNLFDFERPETAGERLFFRVFELFIAGSTVYLAWTWALYTLRISDVVLPLGIARWLDVSFMFGHSLPLWCAGSITALVAFGFLRLRRFGRLAYALAFLLLLLQYAARFSLGEIPHSANTIGMAFLGLSLGYGFFGTTTVARRFALGFTYFYLGLGYTLAACSKLVATGPSWVDGRHLWMWINEKAIDSMAKTGVLEFNWLQSLLLEHHLLATMVLTFGLISESCAFLMWWRRFRTPVIMAIFVLHVGIFFSMNILFKLSMYELLLLGLPWAAWFDMAMESSVGASVRRRLNLPATVTAG